MTVAQKMSDIVKVTFNTINTDMSDDDDGVDAILVEEVNQVNLYNKSLHYNEVFLKLFLIEGT